MQQTVACSDCHGSGTIIEHTCSECDGKGKVLKKVTQNLDIPGGIDDGMTLKIT